MGSFKTVVRKIMDQIAKDGDAHDLLIGDESSAPEWLAGRGISVRCEDSKRGHGHGILPCWAVYSFTNGTDTVYVKLEGVDISNCGTEYEKWFFVEPKTTTVYLPVKG